jgi:hypothetical protein
LSNELALTVFLSAPSLERGIGARDSSIGRIVSVTGSKAIVLLDGGQFSQDKRLRGPAQRLEIGTLLAIDTTSTAVLAIVSALSVPVPAQREGEKEVWIAELGLVGELWLSQAVEKETGFNRGVTMYPTLGDRVRLASKPELELAFCGDLQNSVRVGCIRQDQTIPAMVRVNDLLGKHFAILGTTGTGKSCTTALILRSILERNPAALKARLESISQDPRYMFMFGSLTVFDSMAQILGRMFRVPVNNKPITILELTGLPTEIVNVVVSVLCRMTFDFALWSEGQVPVTLVCEEAHRYVPFNSSLGFEPAKRAIAKIAKEGRKYGASLCIVTQRPAEIDPTILSQCNTVFALRMSNDRDQEIVSSAIADTGSGMLEILPALGQREAIAFGDGVTLPVRIKFDELPKHAMPRSSTAPFTERWQTSVGDDGFLESIVERWRASSNGATSDNSQQMAMLAETMAIPSGQLPAEEYEPVLANEERLARAREQTFEGSSLRQFAAGSQSPQSAQSAMTRPDYASLPTGGLARRDSLAARRESAPQQPPAPPLAESNQAASPLRSLREKLMQRTPTR